MIPLINIVLGCQLNLDQRFANFIIMNKVPYSIIIWMIGAILIFFGRRAYRFSIFIVMGMSVSTVINLIVFPSINIRKYYWVCWLVYAISVISGAVVGYLTMRKKKFGLFLIGVVSGLCLGVLAFTVIFSPFVKGSGATAILTVILLICSSYGGLISLYYIE